MFSFCLETPRRTWTGGFHATASGTGPVRALASHNPVSSPAPLVVDLLYLMVPYARSAELELVLVDQLVRLFHDVAQLSGEWLDPVLKRSGNDNIAIVPDSGSIDTLRNIWAGFPNKTYKLTKLYTLSPVRIPSGLDLQADMVTQVDPAYLELP